MVALLAIRQAGPGLVLGKAENFSLKNFLMKKKVMNKNNNKYFSSKTLIFGQWSWTKKLKLNYKRILLLLQYSFFI